MPENPVIAKFGKASGAIGPVGTPDSTDLQRMYDEPAYAGPRTTVRYMTLDDVVQRTAAMLVVIFAAGAASWTLVDTDNARPLLIISLMGGLGLGLYMSFTMKANAVTALLYAAFEGALLGAISKAFNDAYPGIVIQALTGTVCVAGAMLIVYKTGAIRVTPKFTRVLIGASIGVFGLMLVNMIAYLFTPGGLGLRDHDGSPVLAVLFSLACITIAAFMLIYDFDMIEKSIKAGADQKFAWYVSFGLMVTLIWLYIEILRLLSYFRD